MGVPLHNLREMKLAIVGVKPAMHVSHMKTAPCLLVIMHIV